MKITNLKIGTRLGLGFGVVILLLLVVAFIAVSRINLINNKTEEILNDRYAKVMLAKDIQTEVNLQARYLRNAIIGADDPAEVKSSLAKLEASVKTNGEHVAKLKSMLNTDKGNELFKALSERREVYGTARAVSVKLLLDGKGDLAGKHVLKELRPVQNAFFDAIDAMADFQEALMIKSGEQARAEGTFAVRTTIALSALAAIVAVLIGWFITRSITLPVNRAVALAQTVAAGDLSSRIDVDSQDEIGALLQALKEMNHSLNDIVGQVRSSTDEIATATAEVATGNMDLSSRTEQQASALEETASSMEELTSTVKQNSDNARQANQLAVSAVEVARQGGAVVSDVVTTMGQINESAAKIADIIGVIDGIAFQTNILALNAAVEAARAGEQGRGFAVVASEVRNLAQRSAGAAKEIKTLINDSVERVDAGNRLVAKAGTTMTEVVASIQRVTDIMGEISSASHEQEVGIEQINQAVAEMDTVTQQNAALVEEAAAATGALEQQAAHLAQVVSVFKLDMGARAAVPAAARPSNPAHLRTPRLALVG
ncbi:methyl-accepting chemotaxis protein [Duganella sp. 1411]|uniref:methyl-accepting chemotaxis protein n=1 Tax=Duganella sp. 1411 TaxID=2806572 RepID=UPI001AE5565D|nr:methyl-accepting chemotaxis protein [Duganella sp. 1411]MBP1208335.1 methyl-accepting chemotaxis protein [Duganella sp. 1411]